MGQLKAAYESTVSAFSPTGGGRRSRAHAPHAPPRPLLRPTPGARGVDRRHPRQAQRRQPVLHRLLACAPAEGAEHKQNLHLMLPNTPHQHQHNNKSSTTTIRWTVPKVGPGPPACPATPPCLWPRRGRSAQTGPPPRAAHTQPHTTSSSSTNAESAAVAAQQQQHNTLYSAESGARGQRAKQLGGRVQGLIARHSRSRVWSEECNCTQALPPPRACHQPF